MIAVVGKSADEAVRLLNVGEPVALPTETVYGLAAPLTRTDIVEKIYTLKQRPANNPLIVHVLGVEDFAQVAEVSPLAKSLAEKFWPGPLTLVLPKKSIVPDIVTAGQATVAVRSPQALLFREVIQKMGVPLVAPSANKFQHVSPTTAQHVLQDMGDVLSYILDGGPCTFGLESTILSLIDENNPTLLRFGPITKEQLETFLGRSIKLGGHIMEDKEPHLSPGLYKKHYSPNTPLYLVSNLNHYISDSELTSTFHKNSARIYLFPPEKELTNNDFVLSNKSNLQEVAANLFNVLQKVDLMHFSSIWIEKAPACGIGNAINDRLSRAAHFNLENDCKR